MQITTSDQVSLHIPSTPPDFSNSPHNEEINDLVTPTTTTKPFPMPPPSFKDKLLEQKDHINIDIDFSSPYLPPMVA